MAPRALTLLALALATQLSVEGFSQSDNSAWNARFAELHNDLYTAPLPAALDQCRNKGKSTLAQVTVAGNKLSSELAATCGANTLCIIEGAVEVDRNWNVGALIVKGSLALSGGRWLWRVHGATPLPLPRPFPLCFFF
ncbi:unnamed protein product [Pelagomonas calceolata]|uniref:Uncharacterized protein n=1 Tax=Pelagomonas calceolata TaxID=35677 RepID=A0A8J2SDB4_9STRA|nr:unnamed protein product [Pelagomonas calceolata]